MELKRDVIQLPKTALDIGPIHKIIGTLFYLTIVTSPFLSARSTYKSSTCNKQRVV